MDLDVLFQGLNSEKTFALSVILLTLIALIISICVYIGLKIILHVAFRDQTKTLKEQIDISTKLDKDINSENEKRSGNPYSYVLDKYVSLTGTVKFSLKNKDNLLLREYKTKLKATQKRISIRDFSSFLPRIEWKYLDHSSFTEKDKYRNSTLIVTSIVEISDEQSQFYKITGDVQKECKLLSLSQAAMNKLIHNRTSHLRRIIDLKGQASKQVQQPHYENQVMKNNVGVCSEKITFKGSLVMEKKSKVTYFFDKAVAQKAHRDNARKAKAKAKACSTPEQEQKPAQTVDTMANQVVPTVSQMASVTPVVVPVVQPLNQTEYNVVPAEFGIDLAEQAELDIQNSFEEEPQYG
ncbi:hypothetical protein THF1C08_50199 [Vibrio jasicida]|uniref:Uncharacterized protein n=1 Tax=Vibrio jasicida TaxID=766224 RepID=A0AAU9QTZ0_9VIBR|nr:hypothetical protein THF1C08_50199 [Vibrio jasicida]CAH1601647.1 hypothetical protein THF1A12_50147 [Vibrio jasicida]